ncbi:hypothetical protein [Aurantiacibacter poecillastricola]|uniref:hypothetical protein n=1 Tax=Aurantiacibacter poecillastricola TaxID=3064385 RepID=UPI00273E2108|nr:hypothetical protein [Aurantiacibacter sp. 219JJ12-13]MDP5262854.1 hypothetical protein [Aurantiacibacter sp. 219JJ12-13]
MKIWVATVSALALGAMPVLAQGNGNGNGNNGNRSGPPAQAGPSNPGNGGGGGNKAERGNNGGGQGQARGNEQRGGPPPQARGNGNASSNDGNANRGNSDRGGPPVARGNDGNNGGGSIFKGNAGNANGERGSARDRVSIDYDGPSYYDFRRTSRSIAEGCPPGLARKRNGCQPPGQARKDRYRYSSYAPDWWGIGDLFADRSSRYFYDDGYLMRLGRDGGIAGYIPLLGGAMSIGNVWPDDYRYSRMPAYYEDYYGLGGRDRYRYTDNVIYRLDPETAAITSIAALLTGDDFTVGQRMPQGYDVYNVPYGYRDRYYDRPDAMYRYSDGYVYEIDPATRLVSAAIELLV